uniref:Uncharacterized protein n=1 Tax=Fagus sylvatica TaxID=28930 RepID=A0A2N9GSE0_FAGSY
MQHIVGKLSTSSFQQYKVYANRSSDERVMAPGSRGVGAVFVHFSGEDSGQTGDAIGEPRVPRRSWSHSSFQRTLGSRINLLARTVFRSGFRLDPDKILAIREFHVVHECVLLSNMPGLVDQLVASQEDSARKRGNVGGKSSGIFQHSLISSACFHAREASLGSQDMILRIGGRWNVPYAKGSFSDRDSGLTGGALDDPKVAGGQFDSAFGPVNGLVKPSKSNLVKPGQTWSNLVKFGQTSMCLGLRKMCPGPPSWEYLMCYTVRLGSRASLFGVRTDIPGVEEDRTGCEEAVRGSKSHFGEWQGTRASSSRAARDDAARGPTFIRAARLFSPISTLIDDPSSPTRPTGKHLSIPALLFSFERSD